MKQTRLPTLSALKAFEAVARRGSMKEASSELHVTPGAISQLVRKLEDELSIKLFERKNRELALTEDGVRLSEGALNAFDILKHTLRTLPSNTQQQKVSIACEVSIANNWLAPRVGQLLALNPNLNVEIHTYKSASDVKGVSLDLMVTTNREDVRDMQSERVGQEVYSVVAAPHYLRKFGLSSASLYAQSTLITYQKGNRPCMPEWADWFREIGLNDEKVGKQIGFGEDFDHALIAARNGAGLLLAPLALVSHDIKTGRLVCPRGPSLTSEIQYWVARPEGQPPSVCIEEIRRWLMSEIQVSLETMQEYVSASGMGNVYALRPQTHGETGAVGI